MRIGITEQGDAGVTTYWQSKLPSVDGAILITKNITQVFHDSVLSSKNIRPLIVHATITGWGHTVVEPHVPEYKQELDALCSLIRDGFPVENCVLRIDPIIPTEPGLRLVTEVLNEALARPELKNIRIRVSILDEYRHVKKRLNRAGYASFYGNSRFQPNQREINDVIKTLEPYYTNYGIQFETCAETKLTHPMFLHQGCISTKDLEIMGLSIPNDIQVNPQQRNGCLCLSCKTELLCHKHPCMHECLYCYWKD